MSKLFLVVKKCLGNQFVSGSKKAFAKHMSEKIVELVKKNFVGGNQLIKCFKISGFFLVKTR